MLPRFKSCPSSCHPVPKTKIGSVNRGGILASQVPSLRRGGGARAYRTGPTSACVGLADHLHPPYLTDSVSRTREVNFRALRFEETRLSYEYRGTSLIRNGTPPKTTIRPHEQSYCRVLRGGCFL